MSFDDSIRDTEDDVNAALLLRYATGDAAAARLLVTRLTPRVFGHAMRVLGDGGEAEDVSQEAMMRLWRVAPDWRSGGAEGRWGEGGGRDGGGDRSHPPQATRQLLFQGSALHLSSFCPTVASSA